ncbi:PP2C family protein-serine/threonine phosphatase [Micromonospora zhanjiangensis]
MTRYVGHGGRPEPDLLNVSLRPGDVYCLCTDGVAEQVDYQRLRQRLGGRTGPVELLRGLLADTLAAGGHDNATAAIMRVEQRLPAHQR